MVYPPTLIPSLPPSQMEKMCSTIIPPAPTLFLLSPPSPHLPTSSQPTLVSTENAMEAPSFTATSAALPYMCRNWSGHPFGLKRGARRSACDLRESNNSRMLLVCIGSRWTNSCGGATREEKRRGREREEGGREGVE